MTALPASVLGVPDSAKDMAAKLKRYANEHDIRGPVKCHYCGTLFDPTQGEGFIYECQPSCTKHCFDFYTDS